jgi:hypothetical protein
MCLNFDECAHIESLVLQKEELKAYSFKNKFVKCSECSSTAIIVSKNFSFLREEGNLSNLFNKKIKSNEY